MRTITIALAQLNPVVGDITGNAAKILCAVKEAKSVGADMVVLPELMLVGYPPEDLLLNSGFIETNIKRLEELAAKIRGITAVVGFVDNKGVTGGAIYNGAAIINGGSIVDVYHKTALPNYGVFDEQRYFTPGAGALNISICGVTVGISICEDIWDPGGPLCSQAKAGADVIVNLNASPYHIGKEALREEILATRSKENSVAIVYVNMVGGQDELVFDGRSLIFDKSGVMVRRGLAFEEELIVERFSFKSKSVNTLKPAFLSAAQKKELTGAKEEIADKESCPVREVKVKGRRGIKAKGGKKRAHKKLPARLNINEEVYGALVLGTRDYVRKNGFKHVVIGLSGGIDSALVAAIATDALGAENITVIFMPTRYTAKESFVDAKKLAVNLGVEFIETSIEGTFTDYLELLRPMFKGAEADVTEENLQARIRGNIIMAMSNKFNSLVLTTGNKSEMSVGYATLYGDMAGGFAVIKDISKMLVYELSVWINRRARRRLIPQRIITRPPSAELRPDQTDQDTLPQYEILDAILKAYVEEDRSVDEIVALGFKRSVVCRIIRMVDLSEYKRRQAPPGIKITPRALGKDRRMPITNGYSGGTFRKDRQGDKRG